MVACLKIATDSSSWRHGEGVPIFIGRGAPVSFRIRVMLFTRLSSSPQCAHQLSRSRP